MVAWREDGQGYFTFEEVFAYPVVRKMILKFRPEQQYEVAQIFYNVQRKHYNAWESVERKEQHSLNNIQKVEFDNVERCFKVYYKKTKRFSAEWYHYTLTGEWY